MLRSREVCGPERLLPEAQANAIVKHIDYVVGQRAIGDEAAIKFAVGFYDALAAGKDYEKAFKFGCNAIDLKGIPEYLTPVLKKKYTSATVPTPTSSASPSATSAAGVPGHLSGVHLPSAGSRCVCSRWRFRQHCFCGGHCFTGLGYS